MSVEAMTEPMRVRDLLELLSRADPDDRVYVLTGDVEGECSECGEMSEVVGATQPLLRARRSYPAGGRPLIVLEGA